ncbi:hypothetical protein [Nocardia sp. NPDC050710]|uniref:hypothetical protein n=1 Tax=Nocardia sp. NPDC050710 TaxID=3157220 RepID=UPI0033F145FD
MGNRGIALATVTAGICLALAAPTAAADADALVPDRTALSFRTPLGFAWGTANERQPRASLSLSKLFLVDYALRHGDGSDTDRQLAERMIRLSDDGAADVMAAKYPQAIDTVAEEYHLTETRSAGHWSATRTSSADVADFLNAKLRSDPASPILTWMAQADRTAADGTEQNWGTAQLPRVLGTKWGWSDFGPPEVASASYGSGFAVAAHTYGTPADQTDDVLAAQVGLLGDLLATLPAKLVDILAERFRTTPR